MTTIKEINTTVPEGKLLLMAIAALTVSPSICVNGKLLEGTKMTPDEMLIEISTVSDKVFNSNESSVVK